MVGRPLLSGECNISAAATSLVIVTCYTLIQSFKEHMCTYVYYLRCMLCLQGSSAINFVRRDQTLLVNLPPPLKQGDYVHATEHHDRGVSNRRYESQCRLYIDV